MAAHSPHSFVGVALPDHVQQFGVLFRNHRGLVIKPALLRKAESDNGLKGTEGTSKLRTATGLNEAMVKLQVEVDQPFTIPATGRAGQVYYALKSVEGSGCRDDKTDCLPFQSMAHHGDISNIGAS
jgi:hypothetical protein